MNAREHITQTASDYGDAIVILEPPSMDVAIVGQCALTGRVIYDRQKIILALIDDGMTRDEAEEWFCTNTMPEQAKGWPIFLDTECIDRYPQPVDRTKH